MTLERNYNDDPNAAVFDICASSKPVPFLQMHGTEDTAIPYEAVPHTIGYWIMYNQTSQILTEIPDLNPDNGNTAEYYLFGGGTKGITVEHFRINGGGHTWFSQPNHDVDSSEEAWKFFS